MIICTHLNTGIALRTSCVFILLQIQHQSQTRIRTCRNNMRIDILTSTITNTNAAYHVRQVMMSEILETVDQFML